MVSSTFSTSSLLSVLASAVIALADVHFSSHPVLVGCYLVPDEPDVMKFLEGMVIFWTAQTICFSIDQQTGSTTAGHAVIVFICECRILKHNPFVHSL